MVEHLTRFTSKKKANYWISNRSVSIRTSDVAKMSQRSGKAAESDMKGLIWTHSEQCVPENKLR